MNHAERREVNTGTCRVDDHKAMTGFVKGLGDDVILKYGLDRSEDIYFCSRPC